jgi:hypothetical protein
MAAIQGMRGTGQFDADHRPKNYRELFTLLEPNGNAPLNAMLAMGSSSSTNDPEYKNFRDALPERRVTVHAITGTAASGTAITIIGDDNKFVVPGTILVNSGTGEVMRVSTSAEGTVTINSVDVTKNDLGVVRNVGAGAAQDVTAADVFFIAGHAAAEGASTPTPISFDASVESNYTQIFRTAFSVTNTLNATYLRTGNKEDEQRTKALKLHMSDIERAMIFGKKSETNGDTSTPLRTTGGLIESITNKKDAKEDYATVGGNGVITEAEFDMLLIEDIFKYGSNQKIAFVGPRVAGLLQQIGKNRFQPTQVQGTYGVNLTRYQTFAGDLLVHLHPQFRQLSHMHQSMLVVDFPDLEYRHLDGRDTQLLENRQNNDEDLVKHEYLTECGLEMKQDLTHAYITNWGALA